ncbi:4Fe-4S binding protein [Dissulfurirhabdus thermomarina]|uniref:4Fe-4S binding protein n=1 Tax=Dissulfurirhabdus thermomarina TaxID=1765737 RepID=UPI0035A71B73
MDAARCDGCGECAEVCGAGAIEIRGGVVTIRREVCYLCGACAATCPRGLIG